MATSDPRITHPISDRIVAAALEEIREDVENVQDAVGEMVAVPTPPETGIFHLISTDGVLTWEEVSE